jgi:perosamine synthetase
MESQFMKININQPNLALNGGCPIRSTPWLDNFTLGEEEKSAVIKVMDSGYLSLFEGSHTPDAPFSFKGGPEVLALEQEWCESHEVKHAISVNSATSGLYAAVGALGLGYGDEVIVSPYTMTASAIAPMIYGAIPVFADVEKETGCLCPKSVEKLISNKTKGIIVVHQFGIPADMDEIMRIAKLHGIVVIEDCAQSHGAKYHGKTVGSIGDIGVFSFNVNKTIQTGEGGICTTQNDELAYRLELIRNHGEAVVGASGYDNITNIAGYNYRMTELVAAIGRVQLKRLPSLNKRRLELVNRLTVGLASCDFLEPILGRENCHSTYYIYPTRFNAEKAGISRDVFVQAMKAEGILFSQGYTKPLYLQPLYQRKHLFKHGYPFTAHENRECRMDYFEGIAPIAERLYSHEMLINEHVREPQSDEDIDCIINAIKKLSDV